MNAVCSSTRPLVMRSLVVVSVMLGLAAGCSKGGAAAAGDGGGAAGAGGHVGAAGRASVGQDAGQAIPLDNLCAAYTKDLCVFLTQCGGTTFKDMAHCLPETDCLGVARLVSEVGAGAIGYDAVAAGACQARFLADPCHFANYLFTPNVFEVFSQCPGTVTPMRAVGDPCVWVSECAAGSYCQRTAGKLCPGTCTPYRRVGETCSAGVSACAPGNYCIGGTCRVPPKPGDACTTNADCGPAGGTAPLWCDVAGTGTCHNAAGLGATCGEPSPDAGVGSLISCASPNWCDALFVNDTGTCRAPSGGGAPCGNSTCLPGFHCVGYVPLGSNATLGTCVGPGASGEPCEASSDCAAGLGCPSGTCAPLVAVAGACSSDTDCQSGLFCPNGVCLSARYPGESCADASSGCLHSLCKAGTCVDHLKAGQPCAASTDCISGSCTNNVCLDTSVCGD
jgi:hypothetical protein